MTIRKHGASRPSSSGRSGSPAATPKGGPAKLGVCMTCHEEYDVEFVAGIPKFYDHGTRTPHRCKEKP